MKIARMALYALVFSPGPESRLVALVPQAEMSFRRRAVACYALVPGVAFRQGNVTRAAAAQILLIGNLRQCNKFFRMTTCTLVCNDSGNFRAY